MVNWRALIRMAALAVLVGGSRPAAGAERAVAVFPLVVEGRVPLPIVETIEAALTDRAPNGHGLRVLAGDELRKKLKKNPRRAVNRCQRRRVAVTCFARLASRLKTDELLVGRAKPTAKGVAVILLAVGRNRSVAPRGQFEIESADEVDGIFTDERLREFYGVSSAPPAAAPAQEVASAAEPTPGPENGSAAGDGAPPGDDPAPDDNVPSAAPTPESELAAGVLVGDAPALAALSPSAVSPLPATESTVSTSSGPTWLTYAGIGLAAVAVAGLGYGGYLGYQSNDVRSTIKRDGTVVQKQAVAKADRANDLARQANLWMGLGGGVMALGITFVGIDLLVD